MRDHFTYELEFQVHEIGIQNILRRRVKKETSVL